MVEFKGKIVKLEIGNLVKRPKSAVIGTIMIVSLKNKVFYK